MFNIYLSEYNPNNLTGQVGGDISSSTLSGYVTELFPHVSSPPSGTSESHVQYRKVFVKNEYDYASDETRIWIEGAEHPDQVSVAIATGVSEVLASGTVAPTGNGAWRTPTNYANGISIGTLPASSYSGIWIRQTLSGIASADPYVSFRLYIGGVLEQ